MAGYIREGKEIERTLGLSPDATDVQLLERLTRRQIVTALGEPDASDSAASTVGVRGAESDRSLIIQGTKVDSHLFPYFVEPEDTKAQLPCSAVLVPPDVIVTTASCYGAFSPSAFCAIGRWLDRILTLSRFFSLHLRSQAHTTVLGRCWSVPTDAARQTAPCSGEKSGPTSPRTQNSASPTGILMRRTSTMSP